MNRTIVSFVVSICFVLFCSSAWGQNHQLNKTEAPQEVSPLVKQPPLLQKDDRLVILGDSISAMNKYTVLVDLYLAACRPDLNIWMFQDAIAGEVTAKMLRRLDETLNHVHPTIAISFYGVNDAGWGAYQQPKADRYEADTRELIQRLNQAKVRVLLASTTIMGDKLKNHVEFNQTLTKFRDITERIAQDTQTRFTDVNTLVQEAQDKMRARADQSDAYDLIGRDGAHADWPAHVAIATAMLRGLGMGQEPIAKIVFDPSTGKATASQGHRIVDVQGDTITVESSRYPFFFLWNNPGHVYSDMPKVAQEIGFFDDLDQFMLVAKGLKAENYRVTWGKVSRTFTAKQLEAGVNLAETFDRTPFDAQLYKLWQLCLVKGVMNATATIDAVYHRENLVDHKKQLASQLEGVSDEELGMMIVQNPMKIQDLYVKKQRELVKPIEYQIRLEAL